MGYDAERQELRKDPVWAAIEPIWATGIHTIASRLQEKGFSVAEIKAGIIRFFDLENAEATSVWRQINPRTGKDYNEVRLADLNWIKNWHADQDDKH